MDNISKEDLNKDLIEAIKKNRYSQVKSLIRQGADVNLKFNFELKKNKQNIKFFNASLLHIAAVKSPKVLNLLLKHKAKVNSTDIEGNTPLHLACSYGFRKSVIFLVKAKCNLSIKNQNKYTPLLCAIYNKKTNIVKILLRNITNLPEVKYDFDYTHIAALVNSPEILDLLLKFNFDINSKDCNLTTPLHWAVFNKSRESIKFLIKLNNLQINFFDKHNNDTPLHWAIVSSDCKSSQLIELLLTSCFINVNLKNKENLTALDLAKHQKKKKSFKLLAVYDHLIKLLEGQWHLKNKEDEIISVTVPKEIAQYIITFVSDLSNCINFN